MTAAALVTVASKSTSHTSSNNNMYFGVEGDYKEEGDGD